MLFAVGIWIHIPMACRLFLKQTGQQAFHSKLFGFSRVFSTTSVIMEKALENLQKNPYYEKYADRIAELQKTSPDEFMSRVEIQQKAKEEDKRRKFASVDVRQYSSALKPKRTAEDGGSGAEDKKLSDILKVELVRDKSGADIQRIWEEHHARLPCISGAVPRELYARQRAAVQRWPCFLLPLPREHGVEFMLLQAQHHQLHFTPLLAYQVHKENAPECLTMVHYTELEDKGIVLMRGDYDKNVLNGQEARCLANQFQMYYNGNDPARLQLLDTFTHNPDQFKHMDLISHLENIQLL